MEEKPLLRQMHMMFIFDEIRNIEYGIIGQIISNMTDEMFSVMTTGVSDEIFFKVRCEIYHRLVNEIREEII